MGICTAKLNLGEDILLELGTHIENRTLDQANRKLTHLYNHRKEYKRSAQKVIKQKMEEVGSLIEKEFHVEGCKDPLHCQCFSSKPSVLSMTPVVRINLDL